MFLVDTNVVIRAIAGQEPDAKFLRRAIEKNEVCLSVITLAEFFTRASQKEEGVFEKLVQAFPVFSIDEETARIAAFYRKRFLKKTRAKLLDFLLAAQAKVHKATFVTNNRSDFPMKDILVIAPS